MMFMRANVYDMDLCNNTVKKCGSWYLTGWPHLFYKKRGKCKCQVDQGTAWRCLGCREKGHISPGPRLWFQVVLHRLVKALITLLCRSDGSLSLLEKTLTFDVLRAGLWSRNSNFRLGSRHVHVLDSASAPTSRSF